MDFEFETKRTGLANAFAAAGADLLAYMGVGAALAAIPDTEPQQYAVAGTLGMIGKMMPADERLLSSPAAGEEQTGELTDEQIIETMAKYSRFLEPGLYSQTDFDCPEDMIGFARAIERAAIAAHLARKPKAEQPETGKITDGDSARAFVAEWHRKHFPTDRTFTNYIMGRNRHCALAGDFAWQLAKALESMEGAHQARQAQVDDERRSADLHNAIMNLRIPVDPKIPADAGVMLAYKLGHRDARHAAAELALGVTVAHAGAQNADTRDLAYLIEYIPDEAVRNEAKRKLAAGAQNAEAIRNQALEEAEDAVDKVMSEADDSGESAEAVGAYRCLKAIQALRIANGGSRV